MVFHVTPEKPKVSNQNDKTAKLIEGAKRSLEKSILEVFQTQPKTKKSLIKLNVNKNSVPIKKINLNGFDVKDALTGHVLNVFLKSPLKPINT
ncbi:hypothetical protein BpHYR1_052362 [Brachionus plicatilis]|uniref:Uncharacterized protein n=1 Tax=Brachionus plicatilis TaxID=10195 RepID=A0A3M7T153_BRAPC|nr:hypothetical protein BpHYR1_052362 [Brachionus plicatilis]